MYRVVGPHSELTVENRRLLYYADIVKPVYTYINSTKRYFKSHVFLKRRQNTDVVI